MWGIALVVGVAVVLAGCVRDESAREVPDPFEVAISEDAASASHAAGVDLEGLAVRSALRAFELLPHPGKIRIEVALDAARAIPGIGVGGFANPATGDVSVWIDEAPPGGLKGALETWVPATVAHELHHSSRIRMGPGYGITLAEALVTEGLADHSLPKCFRIHRRSPGITRCQRSKRPSFGERRNRSWTYLAVTTIRRGSAAAAASRHGVGTEAETVIAGYVSAR